MNLLEVARQRAAEMKAEKDKKIAEMEEFKQTKWFSELDHELHIIRVFQNRGWLPPDEYYPTPNTHLLVDPPLIEPQQNKESDDVDL